MKTVAIRVAEVTLIPQKERGRETKMTFYDKIDQGDKATTSLYALNNRAINT